MLRCALRKAISTVRVSRFVTGKGLLLIYCRSGLRYWAIEKILFEDDESQLVTPFLTDDPSLLQDQHVDDAASNALKNGGQDEVDNVDGREGDDSFGETEPQSETALQNFVSTSPDTSPPRLPPKPAQKSAPKSSGPKSAKSSSNTAVQGESQNFKQLLDNVSDMQKTMASMMEEMASMRLKLEESRSKEPVAPAAQAIPADGFQILSTAFKEIGSKSLEIERLKIEVEALKAENKTLKEERLNARAPAATSLATTTTVPIHPESSEDEAEDAIPTRKEPPSRGRRMSISTGPSESGPRQHQPRARARSTTRPGEASAARQGSPPSKRVRHSTGGRTTKANQRYENDDIDMADVTAPGLGSNNEDASKHSHISKPAITSALAAYPTASSAKATEEARSKRKAQLAARDLLAQQAMEREEWLAGGMN